MTPRPDEDRLTELALGATPTPDEAAALRADPRLAQEVAALQELLAVAVAPLAPPLRLRERLLADTAEPWWRALDEVSRLVDLGVDEVKAILSRARSAVWEFWEPVNVHLFHFDGGACTVGADVGLVRAAPGTRFPAHRHKGRERVVIVEGELHDDGRVFHVGEVDDRPAGSEHTWTAGPEGVVFAVVLFEGIELVG